MKFSEAWLREWVNPKITTQELAHQLTMAGLEVDSIEPVASALDGVVIGKVLTKKLHPNADKLSVCEVSIDPNQAPLQIVCGATNVIPGILVPVATLGTKLSETLTIQPVTLRGVESFGMLCSEKELGLAEVSTGLMILPEDAPLGESISHYLKLNDHIICLDLTPNRADCLSLLGLARETAALTNLPLSQPAQHSIKPTGSTEIPITIENPERCARYVGRIISDLPENMATPLWMKEKLRRSGVRAIHPVVDITNYVMLELGQPMHAFDLATLEGQEIRVRLAKSGETLALLNQQTVSLNKNTLVIADAKKPIAMAGIMGGSLTAVNENTREILLESAYFGPVQLSGCARSYGLHTDSSHRFERGVDSALQVRAIERATQLIVELLGGTVHPLLIKEDKKYLPEKLTIRLTPDKVNKALGIELSPSIIQNYLQRLGFELSDFANEWQVIPPTYRIDISIQSDLAEEIARLHGYDNIPNQKIYSASALDVCPEKGDRLSALRQLLVAWGYNEIITYSFIEPALMELLFPNQEQLLLQNPISSDMSVMRPSLLPGLLKVLQHNLRHQILRNKLFEIGHCFTGTIDNRIENNHLSGVLLGTQSPEGWANPKQKFDFFDAKQDILKLLKQMGLEKNSRFIEVKHTVLHPGESAEIQIDKTAIGIVGKINPIVAECLDLPAGCYLFEINLTACLNAKLPKFKALSSFPAVRRDIAITLAREVAVQEVVDHINSIGGELLIDCLVFDLYQGEKIAQDQKSLALGLTLQSSKSTLRDEEIKEYIDNIVISLSKQFKATLRQ